jgi:hypothetical protein
MISTVLPNGAARRVAILLILAAARVQGQIVPYASTTVLDFSGGQGTWAGAGQIIEESEVRGGVGFGNVR